MLFFSSTDFIEESVPSPITMQLRAGEAFSPFVVAFAKEVVRSVEGIRWRCVKLIFLQACSSSTVHSHAGRMGTQFFV